jgi:uncharacterized protein (DUF2147 family)
MEAKLMLRTLGLSAGLVMAISSSAFTQTTASVNTDATGVWRLDTGNVTVRVDPCGANLCGRIVGLAKPMRNGKPRTDRHNPKESLRSRPLMGLMILSDMKPAGNRKWEGTIYNADDGRTYSSYMRLSGGNMKVKGCIGPFCKTMTFVRVGESKS